MKLEQLEDRNLLTCILFGAPNDQFTIQGDYQDNTIELASDHVIVDGIRVEIAECFDRIRIDSGSGHDTITIRDQIFETDVWISGHTDGSRTINIDNSEFKSTVTLNGSENDDVFAITGSDFTWLNINTFLGFDTTRLVDIEAERIQVKHAGGDNLTLLLNVDTDHLSILPMDGLNFLYGRIGGRVAMINVDVTIQAIVNGGNGVDMFGFLNCSMNKLVMRSGGSTDIIVAINHHGEVNRTYDPNDVVRVENIA